MGVSVLIFDRDRTSVMPTKRVALFFFFLALALEFLILDLTVGCSLPWDRASATSTVAIKTVGTGLHFFTDNKRFSVVDYWVGDSRIETLVLRESVSTDRQSGVEGAKGMVTVDAFDDSARGEPKWKLKQEGHAGEVVADRFYKVTKWGCCAAPNTYTYFSLADGKTLYEGSKDLSPDEIGRLH